MNDFSILLDTETLDTRPTSIITEIGIIAFNRADFVEVEALRIVPDLFYQLVAGRTFSKDTIEFHRRINTLPDSTRGLSMPATVAAIQNFVDKYKPKRVWIQGTDFDRPVIGDFCDQIGMPLPWDFKISADARTNWATAFPGVKHESRPHRALPDCRATLKDLFAALKELNRLHAV